ncbi:capsule biosynthesis protein [Oceanibium sediminis]|uniref:capsule biosynthesis protein n=1 Tax=Oceanibium sediminis TaxID=2026339 RepID=UPI000DD4CAD2|nr:capsule biosynthesis protein [Oceanibium sediminis]
MADDGQPDDNLKAQRRRKRQQAAEGKGGGKGIDPREVDLETTDPHDLPPYQDPKGRTLRPGHSRRAMREAAALGIEPVNSNHALYIALQNGIDVFEGAAPSILNMAARSEKGGAGGKGAKGKAVAVMQDPKDQNMLTTTDDASKKVPATAKPVTGGEREAAVRQIQRDLIRRRRWRLFALVLRLVVFVGLPTAVVGYYYYNIATPMYETESQFVIQTSENPAASGGLGGLLAGTGFATSQDSIVVQEFLTSREAFMRLNEEFDYVAHFQDPKIDSIQRLPEDASLDEAFAYFRKKMTIGYDPTEGLIRMTVTAATPQDSQRFAEALVGYAEKRVDGLTQEARGDQLHIAEERYLDAEQQMMEAERRVLELQSQRGVMSAEAELSSQMGIINNLELEAERKRLELSELLANPRPSESRTALARAEIGRLEKRIAELRTDLTQTSDNTVSLARISGELRIAETALQTRHLILQESIGAMEAARLEANRQVRYLSLAVAPIAPVEATSPKKMESTILAFFVFMGSYIMVSLTLSILREQVSV